ncbi:C4-dicarboxylate ABC transporter [Synergistales bacterium]|nr:C4-dicarboxylate ABC transporter [Synergistales bacterium]
MKRTKVFLTAALAVILVLQFASRTAFAASGAEYKWRFSIPWTRPLLQKGFEDFVERVGKYTDGKVEIKIFPDGLLGSHDESFKSVQAGDTELAMLVPYATLVPGGSVNFMPWAVSSYAGFAKAFDVKNGILHKVNDKAYQEVNMKPLFTVTAGGYGLGNNVREIKTTADLTNLKFRVSSTKTGVSVLGNMGRGTGMTMETIPWSELYNALSRKVIDGCWGTIGLVVAERQYEVLKYYTDIGFMWDAAQVVINKDLWDGLPGDLKANIEKAADEAMAVTLKLQMDAEALDIETLAKNDVAVYVPTPEEKDMFFKASNVQAVWDEDVAPWFEKAYPGEGMSQKVLDELDSIRKSVEGQR